MGNYNNWDDYTKDIDDEDDIYNVDDNIDMEDFNTLVQKRRRVIANNKRKRKMQLRRHLLLLAVASVAVFIVTFAVSGITSSLKSKKSVDISQQHNATNGGVGTDNMQQVTEPYTQFLESYFQSTEAAETVNAQQQEPTVSVVQTVTQTVAQTASESSVITQSTAGHEEVSTQEPATEPVKIPASVYGKYAEVEQSDIKSTYIAMYDVDNNMLLAGYGASAKIYPASMTKIMTLIVAVENITDMNATGILTKAEAEYLLQKNASTVGFDVERKITATDLLYGLILPSGADSALMLSKMVAGSEEKFAELMNKKCKELGLKSTHFTNSTGLHDDEQYTTCQEMSLIMKYAMENPLCAQILSTLNYRTKSTTKLSPNGIALTNMSIQRLKDNAVSGITILGAKSGYTKMAGNCLASCVRKNGHTYIVVSADASSNMHCIEDAYKLYTDYLP